MKRILIAFLSVFFANVALADNLLHINSNIVDEIFKKHIPPTKQFQALFEYNQIVKERGGITPDEIRRVCAAAGWQTDFAHAMTDGAKCDAFVEDLLKNASVKFYEVCSKDKSGGKCINDFQALTTNMIQATGLAKLYAYHKDKTEKVVCSNTARTETTNNTSTIRGGMNAGMAPTTSTTTHYVQCKSLDKNIFYEFKFNNTRGTSDSTNHRSFKTGICSVFGYKFQGATKKDNREKSGWDICDGATQNACGMINNALNKAHSGYFASWGPFGRTLSTGKHGKVNEAGAGYELSASQLPYCILTANAGIKYDGTAYERTAFGLDGRYFLSKDIQTQGTAELHEYIRKYVVSRGIQIQEFSCAETYVTVKLAGRSDSDDMITCTINGSTVDFFFDDLSESKSTYIKGAKQALDCIVAGGTFTGKKCIGLNKEQCNKVRNANAVSCPECKQIKWNETEQICELPASASAQNLRRGLTYAAMVGGAAASVVITVGTLGTATAPTAVVLTGLAVELLGAGIELKSQVAIDNKADEFFTKANNCRNATCAEKLIKEYLQALSNQQNDLSDTEIGAADKVFADLFEKIPANSKFYKDIIEQGINGQTVESNKRGTFEKGSWNPEQIWRAVGIGLQIIPTVASVGWRVAKKSDKLVNSTAKLRSKLDDASKYIDDALGIQKTTYEDKLRVAYQKYAPNNQSFDDFKKMFANEAEFDKQIEAWSSFEPETIKTGRVSEQYVGTPYSTYDPELAQQLKTIDSEYADDIAKLDDEIDVLKAEIKPLEKARVDALRDQQIMLEETASKRLGRSPRREDWDLPELQDLKPQYDDIMQHKYMPADADYTTEQLALVTKKEELENLKQGYEVARDYEKGKIINATIPDDVADAVAETRRQELIDIIADDDELFAQAERFSSLSDAEKQNFLQKTYDKLDEVTHVKGDKVKVKRDPKSSLVANASRDHNLTPLGEDVGIDEMLETIVHENSHLMDEQVPDMGMLGAQKAKEKYRVPLSNSTTQYETKWDWSTMAPVEERYRPIETKEVYRTNPTEVSSYQVGSYGDHHMMQQIIEKRMINKK